MSLQTYTDSFLMSSWLMNKKSWWPQRRWYCCLHNVFWLCTIYDTLDARGRAVVYLKFLWSSNIFSSIYFSFKSKGRQRTPLSTPMTPLSHKRLLGSDFGNGFEFFFFCQKTTKLPLNLDSPLRLFALFRFPNLKNVRAWI